jgi:rhamnosyltransferase
VGSLLPAAGAGIRIRVSEPLVSIVLLTRNGGSGLRELVAAIARQRTDFPFEVVAVDSGSTDGTAEWLEQSPAVTRVVRIAPNQFNHGTTRNLGIEQARGALVVLIVQDALPTTDEWLARLVAPLRRDPRVAGTFCRQRPRPDARAITVRYLESWAGASPEPRRVSFDDARALDALDPGAQLQACTFDNVCSCLRRSVWEQIPFRATVIAEDLEWARRALHARHSLEYVADAAVVHSHDRSAGYELARTYLLHHRLFELFGLRTIPRARDLARAIASSARLHLRCERTARAAGTGTAGRWRALGLAVAWPLGQYLGGLSASKGYKPVRWRAV